MNPFQSFYEYELFVYTLQQQFPIVQRSTLVLARRGKRMGILRGELFFAQGYRVTIKERLSADDGTVLIEFYGYEIWRYVEKIAWYDAQPHPDNPELASTHPHHKHIPPNIKKNRIPAPNMSFTQPNLPALIAEIEALLAVQP
ncbi:MAG: hypothetical protein IAE79_03315 [Anaerolinea sp.]|nr:hypothetical protein [Anaerolinea sp.]